MGLLEEKCFKIVEQWSERPTEHMIGHHGLRDH